MAVYRLEFDDAGEPRFVEDAIEQTAPEEREELRESVSLAAEDEQPRVA